MPFTVLKSSPKIWATSLTYKKLPNINYHPTDKISTNPVTLLRCKTSLLCFGGFRYEETRNKNKNKEKEKLAHVRNSRKFELGPDRA
jgi:hypothetical protein